MLMSDRSFRSIQAEPMGAAMNGRFWHRFAVGGRISNRPFLQWTLINEAPIQESKYGT